MIKFAKFRPAETQRPKHGDDCSKQFITFNPQAVRSVWESLENPVACQLQEKLGSSKYSGSLGPHKKNSPFHPRGLIIQVLNPIQITGVRTPCSYSLRIHIYNKLMILFSEKYQRKNVGIFLSGCGFLHNIFPI